MGVDGDWMDKSTQRSLYTKSIHLKMKSTANFVVRDDEKAWERLAWAEVLVPGTVNVMNDLWSKDAVRRAAYMFMEQGFAIDLNHDNVDISSSVKVVESFIARPNDPDFLEGSWVVGVHILDADLWQKVLDGEINGFSYEALVRFTKAKLTISDTGERQGITEADTTDGHTHEWWAIVDENNRPIMGGTTDTNGHSHSISTHTVTDTANDHKHRYNLVQGKGGK